MGNTLGRVCYVVVEVLMGGGSSLQQPGGVLCCSQTSHSPSQRLELRAYRDRLQLTSKQLDLLMSSWKVIGPAMEAQGGRLFVDVFQSNKEVAQVFPLMNQKLNGNLDKKEIYEVLQYHGVKVMSRVSEVLHNLDQLTLCVSLIKQTGAYHRRFNGFKPQYFKYFSDPFLGLVHNCLGKEYNSEMRKVYQSVADFLIQTLTEGYNGDVLAAALVSSNLSLAVRTKEIRIIVLSMFICPPLHL